MSKYKVMTNTLSVVGKKSVKKGDIVDESQYGKEKTKSLVNRGFLEPVKEVKKSKKSTTKKEEPKKEEPKKEEPKKEDNQKSE